MTEVTELTAPAGAMANTQEVLLNLGPQHPSTHGVLRLVLEMDGATCRSARLVLGGVAPIPWRLSEVEKLLTGQRITEDLAVRAGELEGVLSAHAEDIVMFDVPPPDNGVRGIDAYRETWPPFFGWLRSGASFDIVELDVTAGDDVAYAWALLRCGTEDEFRKDPDNRLRLTIGLRRDGGRWVVSHEHHSFPDKS